MVRPDTHRIDMDEVRKLAMRAQAAHHHRRRLGLSAHTSISRASATSPTRSAPILMVDMAHFAGLVAGGAHPSPFPHAHVVTTTTHKTLRGPRGGMILTNDEDIAKKINSAIFPGIQGGPLMHVIAAKAVAFGEALTPEFKAYAKNVIDNAKALGEVLVRRRLRSRFGRHRHAPDPARSAAEEAHRQHLREGAGPRAHHLQQERRAVRSREADGHVGHPPRLAGRDHARLRRRRVPGCRPHDRRGARAALPRTARTATARSKPRSRREAIAPCTALPDLHLSAPLGSPLLLGYLERRRCLAARGAIAIARTPLPPLARRGAVPCAAPIAPARTRR